MAHSVGVAITAALAALATRRSVVDDGREVEFVGSAVPICGRILIVSKEGRNLRRRGLMRR